MKTIKIKYVDWWEGFEADKYRIHELLSRHFRIELSEQPDYIIGSVYSEEYKKYNCVRILYTGENVCPDFNLYDYAIGFENLQFGDRYLRVPNFIMNPKYDVDFDLMLSKHRNVEESIMSKSEFCSFVYSNASADPIRERFYTELSKYKKVNSGGRFLNNVGMPEGVIDKCEFQSKHKFSIAFENSSHIGYTTEKIVQCFAAKTIPIYWGNKEIIKLFNNKSFLVVEELQDIERVIAEIARLDNNIEAYKSVLSVPATTNPNYKQETLDELDKFLVHIFEQPLKKAIRRNNYQTIISGKENETGKKHQISLINKLWRRNGK